MGIEVGKYEVGPYLKEMKNEIEISYPQDILLIIAEKKNVAIIGISFFGIQTGDSTPDPARQPVQDLLGNPESNNFALGK